MVHLPKPFPFLFTFCIEMKDHLSTHCHLSLWVTVLQSKIKAAGRFEVYLLPKGFLAYFFAYCFSMVIARIMSPIRSLYFKTLSQ